MAAGCTVDRPGVAGDLAPPADPDRDLVVRALAAERTLVELVQRTRRRHRTLRRDLEEPLGVHRAHVALLTGAVPRSVRTVLRRRRVPRTPAAALTVVVEAEEALKRSHVAGALRAQSGPFARVLAGMAAAAAQQAVVLDRNGPGPSQDGPGS